MQMNIKEKFNKTISKYTILFFFVIFISCISLNLLNASVAKYNVIIINKISSGKSLYEVLNVAIPFLLLTILSIMTSFLFFILDLYIPRHATAKARVLLYDKLLILDPLDFSQHNISEIFNIFGNNISEYIKSRYDFVRNIVNPLTTIAIYSVMFYEELEFKYIFIFLFFYVSVLFLSKKKISKIKEYVDEGYKKNNQLMLTINEFYDNYEEIKILHLEERIDKKIKEYINDQYQIYTDIQRYQMAINLLKELPNIIITILVFINMYIRIVNHYIDIGSYFVVMSIATVYISSFSSIIDIFQKEQERKMVDRPINTYFNIRDENISSDDICYKEKDDLEQLICENITFSYPASSELYKDLDINIKKGEVLIIKGPSGCGKTTLLKLLSGLYNPKEGKIWYVMDGDNRYTPVECRYSFGFHLQTSILFKDTIRNNITLGERYSEKQIYDVLKKVKLYDVVNRKPNGLDEKLGYLGEGLSGGEKQRLALARILLRKPIALFLDESFSAVDVIASKEIYRNIEVPIRIICLHRDEFISDDLRGNIKYLEIGGEQNEKIN